MYYIIIIIYYISFLHITYSPQGRNDFLKIFQIIQVLFFKYKYYLTYFHLSRFLHKTDRMPPGPVRPTSAPVSVHSFAPPSPPPPQVFPSQGFYAPACVRKPAGGGDRASEFHTPQFNPFKYFFRGFQISLVYFFHTTLARIFLFQVISRRKSR